MVATQWAIKRLRRRPDISPSWQDRAVALRNTIRTCVHAGQKRRNRTGQLFCADCGRHLNDDGSET